jgi:hypothetical protein
MAVLLRRIQWIDADGNTRTTQILGNASTLSVELTLLAASQADLLTDVEGNLTVNTTPAPPGGTYRNVTDEADLWYADAGGSIVQITLPAPTASIFLADQETVDTSNTLVAAITAQVVGTVLTASGGVVTNIVGGRRSRA